MFLAMELLLIVHKTTALSGGPGTVWLIRRDSQYVCSFSLLAQRKRTSSEAAKERAPGHSPRDQATLLSRRGRDALRSSMLPGACKLAALKQCKRLFRQPLRCSAA
jgi:hypothetical protein